MTNRAKKSITFALSLVLNIGILYTALPELKKVQLSVPKQKNKLNIIKFKTVGKKDGSENTNVSIKEGIIKKMIKAPKMSDLSIGPSVPKIEQIKKVPQISPLRPLAKQKNAIKVAKEQLLQVIQEEGLGQSPMAAMAKLDSTDINIGLVTPKGISEDELNEKELVFYSFQKRTARSYLNSFFKELYKYEEKYPKDPFPSIKHRKRLSGKITYDRNGDILKIESTEWTSKKQLQDFFMDVLQNLQSLPNPPKELLFEGKLVISFSLLLNS